MGCGLSTCCGKRAKSQETEPLLPQYYSDYTSDETIIPPQSTFNKVADVIAAVQAGKLPTQDQLNIILQHVITSQVFHLQDEPEFRSSTRLSERGRTLLSDVKEILQCLVELGLEKNSKFMA
jgi:hypothetical protein